jgi:hypothetical protein
MAMLETPGEKLMGGLKDFFRGTMPVLLVCEKPLRVVLISKRR